MKLYEVVSVGMEDLQKAVQSPQLGALRAQGYRVVASMPVEERGKTRLAFVMEPPDEVVETEISEVRTSGLSVSRLQIWITIAAAAMAGFGVAALVVVGIGVALAT